MATKLSRRVRREVPAQGRRLVLEVEPAGAEAATISVREKGRRRASGYTITVGALYYILAAKAADQAAALKRLNRLRKRDAGRK